MNPDQNYPNQPTESGADPGDHTDTPESLAQSNISVPPNFEKPASTANPVDPAPSPTGFGIPQSPPQPIAHPSPVLGNNFMPTTAPGQSTQPQQPTVAPVQPNDSSKWAMGSVAPEVSVFGGGMTPGQVAPKKPIYKQKKILIGLSSAIIVILALAAGYVFAIYLPNKPENVWKTGLNRSGKAFDKIVTDTTQKDKLEAFKKTQLNASIDIEAEQTNISGTLDAQYDSSKANFNVTFSSNLNGEKEQKLSADVLSELAKDQKYPDSYFRIIGLKSLGAEAFFPGIEKYDGKWISIDHNFLKKSLGDQSPTSSSSPSSADVAEVIRAAATTTNEYVLTSNPDKAVLKLNQFVAKEDSEGIKTYHYKAGIDKNHAKDYCQALIENISKTNAYKKIPGYDEKTAEKDKKNDIDDCKKSIDTDIKDTDTIDVWIDAKFKLLHKVRVTEDIKDQYFEFGQKYKGGDDLQLFANYHDQPGKADTKITFDTNLKSSESKLTVNATGGEGSSKYKVNVTLTAKPLYGEVGVKKPSESIPIEKVLKDFGLENAFGASSGTAGDINDRAKDAERQTDINAIHGQLEAYYAQFGRYPTQANMNDITWVKTNLIGMDTEALREPDGTTTVLAGTAMSTHYGYSTTPQGCDNGKNGDCTGYTLSALLSDASTYSKKNLF